MSNHKNNNTRSKWLLVAFLTIVMTLSSGYWALNTTSGLQWLLTTTTRMSNGALAIEGINGTFSNIHIDKLHYREAALQLTINRLRLDWLPGQLIIGKLSIQEMYAQRIDIYTEPSSEEDTVETTLPEDLSLPIDITVQLISIDTINQYSIGGNQSNPEFSITDMSIRLESDTQQYRLAQLSFQSELGQLNASGHIQTTPPFKLKSDIHIDNAKQWGVTQAAVSGSLEQLGVKLIHQKAPMQSVAALQLKPFAQDPSTVLETLHARITEFNPADFFPDTADIPKANITLHTAIRQNDQNQLVGQLTLKNGTTAPLDQNGLPLSGISTAMLFTDKTLKLDNLRIQLAEKGLVSGNIAWDLDASSGQSKLNIDHLNPAAIDTQLQPADMNGTVTLAGDANQQHVTVNLNDQALKLNADATHTTNRITLKHIELRHGQSSLIGSGELNQADDTTTDDTQSFHFTGQLKQFNVADFIQGPASNLNTRLNVTGHLSPQLSATLDYQFEKSHLNHQPITGNGNLTVTMPSSFSGKADFQIGPNHLNINGEFGKPGDTLALNITAPSLKQTGFGLSGRLKANIDLKGTLDSPAIDFHANGQALGLPDNQSIDHFSTQGTIDATVLSFTLAAKDIQSNGKTQLKQLDLKVDGKHADHTLDTQIIIDDEITTTLRASGSITGHDQKDTFPSWQGQLTDLTVTGQVPVTLQTPAAIKLSSEQITIQHMYMSIAGGEARINHALWSPENWQSEGYFSGIKLHSDDNLTTNEEILHLGGKWDIKSPASLTRLNGNMEIQREKGDWYLPGSQPAGLKTLKFRADADNGALTGRFDLVSTSIGEVHAQLTLPHLRLKSDSTFSSDTPLQGQLNADLPDLSLLSLLTDNTIQTDGQITLHTKIGGTFDKPLLQGDIHGEKLAIASLDLGLNLHQGLLKARLDQSTVHVDQLNFMSPYQSPPKNKLLNDLELEDQPGSLAINGSLSFLDNTHHLTVALDHLYLAYPPHYWIVASGKNTVQFVDNTLEFNGKLTADAGLIMQPPDSRPQLADDVIVVDNSTTPRNDPNNAKQASNVKLHASLDLGKHFYLRAAGLKGQLVGNVQLQNDENGTLNAIGSIATQQAAYKAYGQDLTVTRGIVNFNGPIDDPGLNILAARKGLSVEAGVEVTGSVRHPKVKLVSTPDVPDTEKLSWIVLGRAPDSSGLDTSMLITAATAILGSESGGITDQLSDMLGVDEISFRQGKTQAGTGSTLSNQIGTVGKRLSSRAYLSYERGITATTAGITKLTYSLTPKIKVVTQAGEDSAVDLFYTFRFD